MNLIEWIRKILTLWRGFFSLIICLIFSLTLQSLKPSERVVFHEVMIESFLFPIQNILSNLEGTLRIYRENKDLKRANVMLRVENDLIRQQVRQYPRDMEMERFRSNSTMPLKAGRIIAQDAGRLQRTWVINLGRVDSVERNMPVLSSKGLVGKTSKCFFGHCIIQLYTDPEFKVSVQCDRSRSRGILESFRVNSLVARFPAGSDVHEGDTLITAGLGGVFPKGLRMGLVEENLDGLEESNSDVLRSFKVKPFQEINTVEEVFVYLKQDSWSLKDEELEEP